MEYSVAISDLAATTEVTPGTGGAFGASTTAGSSAPSAAPAATGMAGSSSPSTATGNGSPPLDDSAQVDGRAFVWGTGYDFVVEWIKTIVAPDGHITADLVQY